MRIKYAKAIQESEEDLTKLEQRLRGQKAADRVCVCCACSKAER
jgi:hypothetical protein